MSGTLKNVEVWTKLGKMGHEWFQSEAIEGHLCQRCYCFSRTKEALLPCRAVVPKGVIYIYDEEELS